MPTILDLFDPDYLPNREFERVIQPDDPQTLFRDLRDYVLPPEVKAWLFDQPNGLVHQYLASANSVPDAVCTWITGFFGSGKSHLLKVIAHLLCNTIVQDEGGAPIEAARFICHRFAFDNIATLITSQLVGRPLVVQMLEYARSDGRPTKEASISHIILSRLERSLGYSSAPWIALLERLFEKHSQIDNFRQFVAKTTEDDGHRQEWDDIKNDAYLAHPLLVQGLHKFLPRTYKTEEFANNAVRVAETTNPAPESLVRRLAEEAKAIDAHKGRMIVCLDEVRLYLGDNPDRITELQVIAQNVKSLGQGKVFLIVTGQEAPEDVDSRFHHPGGGIGILADRFPEKFRLSENNIDFVVSQRLLRKSNSAARIQQLRDLIGPNRPQLSTATCIRNSLQNPNGRFTNTDPDDLERYYPLLPYHVILLQEVLSRLRSTGPSGGVVGTKERAILIIIRALFGEPANPLLAAAPVGALATFDRFYDVLEEELKGIHLNQRDQVAQIQQSADPDAALLTSVAKAVLLLQQAARRYFRVTDEVVAAALYARLGDDPNSHFNRVKNALKKLTETGQRYLTIDPELGYRFLTETETRFEKIVAEQDVTEAERFAVLQESVEAALKKKFFKYEHTGRHGKRKFEVKVSLVDTPDVPPAVLSSGNHLELRVFTPVATTADTHWSDVALMDSTSHPECIVWCIKELGRLYETVDRIVRVRKALRDSRLNTNDPKEQEQIESQRQRVEKLAADEDPGCLPTQILQGISQGTLVWNGEKKDLSGIPVAEEVFAQTANKAIQAVYTEFDAGSATVVDGDLREVLTWKTTRPKCVEKLELMDTSGKVLLDRPVLKTVADTLRRADHAADAARRGESLATEFDTKPYGWDEHVVRAALAVLLRAGALIAKEGAVLIRTATESKAAEILSGWNRFKNAVFEYIGELTPEQRQAATRAIQSLFGRAGEDTFEKIDRALGQILDEWLPQVTELAGVSQAMRLPCVEAVQSLRSDLKAVQNVPAGTQRILTFVDADRQTRLAKNVPAITAIQQFRTNGSLDHYQKISSFVRYPATPFVQRVGDDLRSQLDALRGDLGDAEFYAGTRWSAITQAHTTIRQAYVADYHQNHNSRKASIDVAVTRIQHHRNWPRLEPAAQQTLVAPLTRVRCDAIPGALDETTAFICQTCQTDSNSLASQVATIPSLEAQAITHLDALDRPPLPPPGVETIVLADGRPVRNDQDITTLTDELASTLADARTRGEVTVDICVHAKPV